MLIVVSVRGFPVDICEEEGTTEVGEFEGCGRNPRRWSLVRVDQCELWIFEEIARVRVRLVASHANRRHKLHKVILFNNLLALASRRRNQLSSNVNFVFSVSCLSPCAHKNTHKKTFRCGSFIYFKTYCHN